MDASNLLAALAFGTPNAWARPPRSRQHFKGTAPWCAGSRRSTPTSHDRDTLKILGPQDLLRFYKPAQRRPEGGGSCRRYITDRKRPTRRSTSSTGGRLQMLLPESRRRSHRPEESRRGGQDRPHPAEVRLQDRHRSAAQLEGPGRAVFGQDEDPLSPSMKMARPACAIRKSRSAPTCSAARPASARPKSPSSCPRPWASSCSASTCPSTWSGTPSAA